MVFLLLAALLLIAAGIGALAFKIFRSLALASFAFIGFLVLITLTGPKVYEFFAIDDCLDSGGRWNRESGVCEGLPQDSSR